MERKYEVMFILRPDVIGEEADKLIAGFEATITKGNGKLVSSEKLGNRKLANTVRKFNEGNYNLLTVEVTGSLVAELERLPARDRACHPSLHHRRMDEEEKRINKIKKLALHEDQAKYGECPGRTGCPGERRRSCVPGCRRACRCRTARRSAAQRRTAGGNRGGSRSDRIIFPRNIFCGRCPRHFQPKHKFPRRRRSPADYSRSRNMAEERSQSTSSSSDGPSHSVRGHRALQVQAAVPADANFSAARKFANSASRKSMRYPLRCAFAAGLRGRKREDCSPPPDRRLHHASAPRHPRHQAGSPRNIALLPFAQRH